MPMTMHRYYIIKAINTILFSRYCCTATNRQLNEHNIINIKDIHGVLQLFLPQ